MCEADQTKFDNQCPADFQCAQYVLDHGNFIEHYAIRLIDTSHRSKFSTTATACTTRLPCFALRRPDRHGVRNQPHRPGDPEPSRIPGAPDHKHAVIWCAAPYSPAWTTLIPTSSEFTIPCRAITFPFLHLTFNFPLPFCSSRTHARTRFHRFGLR